MARPPLPFIYAVRADLDAFLSSDGVSGRVDDDVSGGVSTAEQAYIDAALTWASARVNQFCLGQYAASELALSWTVNWWASALAADFLSRRRGNPPPSSIKGLYDEVIAEMKEVRDGLTHLPDIGLRTAAFPGWTSGRVDTLYSLRKWRTERPLSSGDTKTLPVHPQSRDVLADYIVEPNN